MVFILAGMLLALLSQFGIAPRIVARQDLRLWHSVGTAMYALQWCCALRVFWLTLKQDPAGGESLLQGPSQGESAG